MSATVFCTFDQQDLADLAMGKLRNSVRGIHSIQYLEGYGTDYLNRANQNYNFVSGLGLFDISYSVPGVQPSHPVSVKIVCDDNVRDIVKSRLVNLHAYKIIAS